MASVVRKQGSFSVRAYRGDAKTLLAFNLSKTDARKLAGFTVQVEPPGLPPYFLLNQLQFKRPADHAQDATLPANSSINAPIHKFRWLHVPGSANQTDPVFGKYKYTVTPRYFDDNEALTPIQADLSIALTVDVAPFAAKKTTLGFTRGFVQSQAFVRHFGRNAVIQPKKRALIFDTSQVSGTDAKGKTYTFDDQYQWLGFTARKIVLELLDQVIADKTLTLDVFAYDLNEPDVVSRLIKLAKRGGVRVILDNAALHHNTKKPTPEDQFEKMFKAAAKAPAEVRRGHFQRYSHDKIFIVSKRGKARKVMTGSTNLSITGLYVNSNHIIVFDDPVIAGKYAEVFTAAWNDNTSAAKFRKSPLSMKSFIPSSNKSVEITFSPHDDATAKSVLDAMAARIAAEAKKSTVTGSVLFAVMDVAGGSGSVLPALKQLHASESVFSYGISDNPGGIALYKPGNKTGVLVTGKPSKTKLPPPFSQVPGVGLGHQIHHKFVVCGFKGKNPVVYCGSSNLAQGGEVANGDNLLAIHDKNIATVFACEALALVDHFDFLNSVAAGPKATTTPNSQPEASKPQAAIDAGWFLSTTDRWTQKYFDDNDLKSVDRRMFA